MAVPAVLLGLTAGLSALSVFGGFQQASAYRSAGRAAVREGKFLRALSERRAQAMDIQAGQERASAQRSAIEARRQGNFVAGRTRALAAASGADPSSPTIVGNLADLAEDTDLRAATSLFEGESRGRALQYEAAVERLSGAAQLEGARYQRDLSTAKAGQAILSGITGAGETIMSSAGHAGLFQKYGKGGPTYA